MPLSLAGTSKRTPQFAAERVVALDGTNDSAPAIQAAIEELDSAGGGVLYINRKQNGDHTAIINSIASGTDSTWGVLVKLTNRVRIVVEPGIVFKAGPDFEDLVDDAWHVINPSEPIGASNGAFFRFEADVDATTDAGVEWIGGEFDFTGLTGEATGINGIVTRSVHVSVRDTFFNHHTPTPSGATFTGYGDSSLFALDPLSVVVERCKFYGAPDLAIYMSGNNDDFETFIRIQNNRFYRCSGGVAFKRLSRYGTVSHNWFEECGSAIFNGGADGLENHGKSLTISDNDIIRTQGNPIYTALSFADIIHGNRITDWRRYVSDGTTETVVSSGNVGGAIKLMGSKQATVYGNVCRFLDWVPVETANKETCGLHLGTYVDDDAVTQYSTQVRAFGNVIVGTSRDYVVQSGCEGNDLRGNMVTDIINGSVVAADDVARDESGSITPTLESPGGAAPSYTYQRGGYILRGKWVEFWLELEVSSITGMSGTITVAGFPYAHATGPTLIPMSVYTKSVYFSSSSYFQFAGLFSSGSVLLMEVGSYTTNAQITEANLSAASRIHIRGSYPID